MPTKLFECNICKTVHKSFKRAESCEKKGRPELAFRNGQAFDQPYSDGKRQVVILSHNVIRSWGKHINRYKVNWGGRITWHSEKSIKRYVARNIWIPV